MAEVKLKSLIMLIILLIPLWVKIGFPLIAEWAYPDTAFVTNIMQTGGPKITVSDGPLKYGDEGSPWVTLDWLAKERRGMLGWYDMHRTINIYEAYGDKNKVCSLVHNNPEEGWFNRSGVPLTFGFSLDRWTHYQLEQCPLKSGVYYTAMTHYYTPVLGGLATKEIMIPTTKPFLITEDPDGQ